MTRLRNLQELVLLSLRRIGPDTPASEVKELIRTATGESYPGGAIQTVLSRLEVAGLISSRWSLPQPIRGGRRTRLYRLEQAGRDALQRLQEEREQPG